MATVLRDLLREKARLQAGDMVSVPGLDQTLLGRPNVPTISGQDPQNGSAVEVGGRTDDLELRRAALERLRQQGV
jgi:hypothetical protein